MRKYSAMTQDQLQALKLLNIENFDVRMHRLLQQPGVGEVIEAASIVLQEEIEAEAQQKGILVSDEIYQAQDLNVLIHHLVHMRTGA
jgi:hypothetical protein